MITILIERSRERTPRTFLNSGVSFLFRQHSLLPSVIVLVVAILVTLF